MEISFLLFFIVIAALVITLFILYWKDYKDSKKIEEELLLLRAKHKLLHFSATMFMNSRYCKLCDAGFCVVCDNFREMVNSVE